MSEDKNIRDIFVRADLGYEDWLEPSDKVLEEIEATIYAKKRNRWFWFLLPFIFLVSGTGVYFYLMYPNPQHSIKTQSISNNENDIVNNQLASSTIQNKPQVPDAIKEKREDSKADQVNIETFPAKKDKNISTQNSISLNDEKEEDTSLISANKKPIIKKPFENKIGIEKTTKPFLKNKDLIVAQKLTLNSSNLTKKRIPFAQPEIDVLNASAIYKNVKSKVSVTNDKIDRTKKEVVTDLVVQAVHRLALLEYGLLNNKQNKFLENINSNILPDPLKSLSYEFSTGFSLWNIRLNQPFSKALKPANFTHNMGKGFFVSAGIQKVLIPKISIRAALQYEQVALQSSHSESVTYNINKETTKQTNTFNANVATPLGFVKSDLTIGRTNDAIDEATELNIDLQSRHQIFTVDAGLGLSAQFINFVKLSGATIFYTGIHQVFLVNNRVQYFSTNNTDFIPNNNTRLNEQTQLQKLNPYLGLGLQFRYQINMRKAVQFQYVFKQAILPLYKEDAYKSYLSRQHLGLSYVLHF